MRSEKTDIEWPDANGKGPGWMLACATKVGFVAGRERSWMCLHVSEVWVGIGVET